MQSQVLRLDSLSQLIKQRRKQLGLSQKQLGDLLDIDQRTVSSLENNPMSVSVHRLFAVLDALRLQLRCDCADTPQSKLESRQLTMTVEQLLKNSKII